MLAWVVVEEESVVGEGSVMVVVPPAAVSVLDGTVELVPVVDVPVEVDAPLEDVESLGAVELPPLAALELDRLVGPVDAAGLEPEPGARAEPPGEAVVGAGTDVAPALPVGVGSELGAGGGETLLVLGATGTTGVAGVAWRWIATGETVRTGSAAWLAPMRPVAIATTLISFATTP